MTHENIDALLSDAMTKANAAACYFDQIKRYILFLIKKNEEMNLISRKLSFEQIITDHILDCLLGWSYFIPYNSIADLGTGGGLPGLLFSILFPEKKITLFDKSPKKVLFLNNAVKELKLENTSVINGLVDEQPINSGVITCRAFKSIYEMFFMTRNSFLSGTPYILYKATKEKIIEEIKQADKSFKFDYTITRLEQMPDKQRHLVFLKCKSGE